MINGILEYISGSDNAAVIGIFKALLVSIAAPILLLVIKNWHLEAVKRRDRRRKLYADALSACMEYKEFPYVIYRRNWKKPEEERTRISESLRDVQKRIAHHRSWLMTESKEVANKYSELVELMKSTAGDEMKRRWNDKPIKKDAQMTVAPKFDWSQISKKEHAYIEAVNKELAPFWKKIWLRNK